MAQQYSAPPAMQIDPNKRYVAVFHTEKGDFEAELFAKQAPITVNNFVFLARSGYYNGTTFHRVIRDFMAQGGDPTGTGSGGPGYTIIDEPGALALPHQEGSLSMAKTARPNTAGSQFFIVYSAEHTAHLNGVHAVFGRVISGMDVARSLRLRDPNRDPQPGDKLLSVEILEN